MADVYGGALHGGFLRGLAAAPRRTAVRGPGWALTYEALHERALAWAGDLLRTSPAAVGVLADKGQDAYTGVLAGLYTGATVVPLSTQFPAARIRHMIEAANVSALVADDRGRALLAEIFGPGEGPVLVPGGGAPPLDEPRPAGPDDTAYVLFTSGSTGRPKGVRISHGSTAHYFRTMGAHYDFAPGDVFSQTFDLNFDCAMFDLFCAWGAGATVQQIPPSAYRNLPEFMAETGMTVWFSTPSAVGLIRRMGGLAEAAMPGLRRSFFAGEAFTCGDAAAWQAAAPGSAVENLYGPTELTITISGYRWSPEATPHLAVNGIVPIGGVHEGHDHLLIGPGGEPADEEGELVVTGPQMTAGYLDPADGEGRFLHRDGRAWYRTGDRVRRVAPGVLAYIDRLDGQVQIQGWRVELAEIDHAVRSRAGVEDAVTVAAAGRGGEAELVVFYTGDRAAPADLARALRADLPERMVPRRFEHLDAFPMNPNRKIDRSLLRSWAGA